MGNVWTYSYDVTKKPYTIPDTRTEVTFPPDLGFEGPRKERVMKISHQEMEALKMPPRVRDFCAHLLADYYVCRRQKGPLFMRCSPEFHKYHECEYEDYLLRMKEYEREKRLRIRQQKLEAEAAA